MHSYKCHSFAKINTFLEITGISGSMHTLCSVMQSISLCDELKFEPTEDKQIQIVSKDDDLVENNIIHKVYDLFLEYFFEDIECGFRVKLKKKIPMGAGMGGGSSNAAAAFHVFEKSFKIKIEESEKIDLLLKIGSDVPFCYYGGTKLVEGSGEKLSDIAIEPAYYLIVNPAIHIDTKEAYYLWDKGQRTKDKVAGEKVNRLLAFGATPSQEGEGQKGYSLYYNSFEAAIFPYYEEIAELKQRLIDYGAEQALMTGSGSTVFGTFSDEKKAMDIYKEMKSSFKNTFLCRGVDYGVEFD